MGSMPDASAALPGWSVWADFGVFCPQFGRAAQLGQLSRARLIRAHRGVPRGEREREPRGARLGDGARDARRGAACGARGARWTTLCVRAQLFYSFFKTLVGKEVVVELKNGDTRARAHARGSRGG